MLNNLLVENMPIKLKTDKGKKLILSINKIILGLYVEKVF